MDCDDELSLSLTHWIIKGTSLEARSRREHDRLSVIRIVFTIDLYILPLSIKGHRIRFNR